MLVEHQDTRRRLQQSVIGLTLHPVLASVSPPVPLGGSLCAFSNDTPVRRALKAKSACHNVLPFLDSEKQAQWPRRI